MRIVTAYCPACEANVLVNCLPEGVTIIGAVMLPAVVVRCPKGHVLWRFGAVGGVDPVADILLERSKGYDDASDAVRTPA